MKYYRNIKNNSVTKFANDYDLSKYPDFKEINEASYNFKKSYPQAVFVNNEYVLPEKSFNELKADKRILLENWFKTQLSNNFTFNGNEFELSKNKATDIAQLKGALDFNIANGETEEEQVIKLTSIQNIQINFTYSEFISFGSLYGKTLTSIIFEYKNKRNSIELANNEQELNLIST